MKRAHFAVFLMLLAAPSVVLAWGPIGHRVVGRIAANHLTDEARVAVTCLINVPTNLHSVWDNGLIDSEKLSFSELAAFIDHPTLMELQAWQSSSPADWVRESKAVRERVYKIGDGNLSYQYAFDNMPLVKQRLLQAGVRLAGLLNSIFSQASPSIPDRVAVVPPPE